MFDKNIKLVLSLRSKLVGVLEASLLKPWLELFWHRVSWSRQLLQLHQTNIVSWGSQSSLESSPLDTPVEGNAIISQYTATTGQLRPPLPHSRVYLGHRLSAGACPCNSKHKVCVPASPSDLLCLALEQTWVRKSQESQNRVFPKKSSS